MKGFVATPPQLVDSMLEKLFRHKQPTSDDRLLDPGCGTGAFILGVLRWCEKNRAPIPRIVGTESDRRLLEEAQRTIGENDNVELRLADFLAASSEQYDFIVGNPPYVAITGLSEYERDIYRKRYHTARGRFDLYQLFFEQALRVLKPDGRLVFVTPEKFLYVQTADELRRQLSRVGTEEIDLIDESSFADLVTYPTVTTVDGKEPTTRTRIRMRDGTTKLVRLNTTGASWLPGIHGDGREHFGATLNDACIRISCGVATGADSIYVVDDAELPARLEPFSYPTISGREIGPTRPLATKKSMLVPYSDTGELLPESELGPLGTYLGASVQRERLMQRTCVARKPWYAFHENPPMADLLRPKILCKDIGARPWFVVDAAGAIVPRHSVYYIVPRDETQIHELCEYLNSNVAAQWLIIHCQRAANGFVRLQSHVLKELPVPEAFVPQGALVALSHEGADADRYASTASLIPIG
jgi:SAM-dependent methyltransferase